MSNAIRRLTEGLARRTTRRGLFGRGAEVAFGALEQPILGSSASMPSMAEIVPIVFLAALIVDVLVLLPATFAVRHAYAQRHRPQITGRAA